MEPTVPPINVSTRAFHRAASYWARLPRGLPPLFISDADFHNELSPRRIERASACGVTQPVKGFGEGMIVTRSRSWTPRTRCVSVPSCRSRPSSPSCPSRPVISTPQTPRPGSSTAIARRAPRTRRPDGRSPLRASLRDDSATNRSNGCRRSSGRCAGAPTATRSSRTRHTRALSGRVRS